MNLIAGILFVGALIIVVAIGLSLISAIGKAKTFIVGIICIALGFAFPPLMIVGVFVMLAMSVISNSSDSD